MKILNINPKWSEVPAEIWLVAFSKRAKEEFSPVVADLIPELYSQFFEILGETGTPTHAAVPVVLKKGKSISSHRHPEHLIIYYPVGHPCKLIADGETFTPIRNSAVYLPPNTLHSVQANKNKKPRLSLALRWMPT